MAAYPLRLFGDPALRLRARDVENIDGALVTLVHGMYETMQEAEGLGLAAPQVGVGRRLFTYDLGDGPTAVLNPQIVESSGEWTFEEGCLSVPGFHFEIVRPNQVTMRGLDLDGNELVIEADELMGRLIQHELDHLDGVLLLDRLEPDVRREAMRELRDRDFAATNQHSGRRL